MFLKNFALAGLTAALLLPQLTQAQKNWKPENPIDPSKIEIVRDSYGVPHIFAKTDAEVAYGLEWCTAEDDFDIGQWMLLATKGMLGLHLGVEGAKIDYAVQVMGIREMVANNYEKEMPDDFKRVLEGAAQGINDYVKAHPEEIYVKKAFPVSPHDIVVGYILGQALMGGVDGMIKKVVDGRIYKDVNDEVKSQLGIGSNAYAISPKMSADGQTYHVNNAHQPIEGLLSWYEAHLHSEEGWNISGALFHGGVSIFHGTNEHLAWAHTTGDLDQKDVYMLKQHPRKKNWYWFDGEWRKLETKRAKLRVGLGKNKKFRITIGKKYWNSVYGPTMINDHGIFAMRMPAFFEMKASLQWYRMNKAKNYEEFREALDIQGICMQNITYADDQGNIMFIANGKVPKRDPQFNWKTVLRGDTSATLWTEYIPESELEQVVNPECGYVFNANNSAFENTCENEYGLPDDVDPNIGYRPGKQTNRGNRSIDVLENMSTMSYEELVRFKFDHVFPDDMIFLKDYPIDQVFRLSKEKYPDLKDAIDIISRWDRSGDSTNRESAFMFTAFYNMHRDGSVKTEVLKEDSVKREEFFVKHLRQTKEHLVKHFGRIDPMLGEVQVLKRGDRQLAINGGPDQIRAVYCDFKPDQGVQTMRVGDSFVQLTRFTEDGPIIESAMPFGASNKPDSPHYMDQMHLFVGEKFKPMTLDKEEVYKNAKRIYHPGE